MSSSVSLGRWGGRRRAVDAPPPARVLEPEQLREAGILGDPDDPQDAVKRARGLILQSRYAEARELLTPHLSDPQFGTSALELLAEVATKCVSNDAQSLLDRALEHFVAAGDVLGQARARRLMGEFLLGRGELQSAENFLRNAGRDFETYGEAAEAALCQGLRAQVRQRLGHVNEALTLIEGAISVLVRLDKPRLLALARLERARIMACRGEGGAAAKDLLQAERSLGVSGSAADRLRARIARAETLVWLGEGERAAPGLNRTLGEVADLEEIRTTAWVHWLLGEALLTKEPAASRRHLSRARHLYHGARQDYETAACDIQLARVERRLGLNPESRLSTLTLEAFVEWPLLQARLQIARAEAFAAEDPEATRNALYKARAFALEHGHRALAHEAEQALFAAGLALHHERDDLTPVDRSSLSVSQVTSNVARPVPMPMSLSSSGAQHVGPRPQAAARTESIREVPVVPPQTPLVTLPAPVSAPVVSSPSPSQVRREAKLMPAQKVWARRF